MTWSFAIYMWMGIGSILCAAFAVHDADKNGPLVGWESQVAFFLVMVTMIFAFPLAIAAVAAKRAVTRA